MNRRKAIKIGAGVVAGSGMGIFTLMNAFKNKVEVDENPHKLKLNLQEGNIKYVKLEPDISANLAYKYYREGGCMYTTVKTIVTQLAEKLGEPFTSVPLQMFKYGHGGIGGYGSICGTLNGAASVISLIIRDKKTSDKIIADIFRWYETEPLPAFRPCDPKNDFVPKKSVANSVLCHVSNTKWCEKYGYTISSDERKERCRRLSCDVVKKVVVTLNEIIENSYVTGTKRNVENSTCLSCHGKTGKISNTSTKMNCTSCHSETVGHKVFKDIHYKFIED